MKSLLRTGLLVAAATSTLALAQPASTPAGNAPAAKPPFPQISLPERKSSGQRAIDLLGSRLPEVAAWYGKSPDEFRQLLLTDRRLKIDQRGRLFVEEELDAPLPSTPASGASDSLSGQLAPLDQTFYLHSRPGASRTIYLNFKGATLTNTAWNSNGNTITALPYDLDGVPYAFSTTELQRIQYIWQRVAEDFAPFDVNVTTEQPSGDKLTRSGSTDAVFGTTALITNSNGVYSCSCGGVAYVGVFDDTSDVYKPALVFYNQLGRGNEKYVAEAISHEVGHNLGLLHDGTSSTGYYEGHGSGATGWAPIMGVGYSRSLVQWSKGEYAGANQKQDDYAVMGSNGLAHRADDHGSTSASATPLAGTTANGVTTLAATGVVERPSDVDVFAFTAGAGAASFGLAPAARSANLDAQLDLHNGAGQLLASVNPLEALNATLSTTLPSAGTYYLSVRGVGKGDPLTTGYTNYGSLGQYALTGTVPASTAGQPPVAAATATPTSGTVPLTVSFSGSDSSDPDGSIVSYAWTFGDGNAASGATASNTYVSAGTYTAVLTVTDSSGLTAQRSVTITAQAPVVIVPMRVADIAMGLTRNKTQTRATAAVKVTDTSGNAVPGATVAGRWSGLTTGTASVVTASNGIATFTSANTRAKSGTFTFTVTGVTLSGYSYDSTKSAETSDSISF